MTVPGKPDPKPGQHQGQTTSDPKQGQPRPHDDVVDETIDESFPASDPPAWTSDTGAGTPKRNITGDDKP